MIFILIALALMIYLIAREAKKNWNPLNLNSWVELSFLLVYIVLFIILVIKYDNLLSF